MRVRASLVAGAAALTALTPLLTTSASASAPSADQPSTIGTVGPIFAENAAAKDPTTACKPGTDPLSGRPQTICSPAAASVMVLPNGKILYWDALEGMEDVKYNVVAEYGASAQNDQSRLMDLASRSWSVPTPYDSGTNATGADDQGAYLPGVPHDNSNVRNDGDLFCSDQVFLADGTVLDAGGTFYYQEPAGVQDPTAPGRSFGVTELQGLKNTRLYDTKNNTFRQSGRMNFGRWYPSLVTLPDGKVFVASGVTKLLKPVYPDRPADSGTNVEQTETYNPAAGVWTVNGTGGQQANDKAARSLPLFPRLHLLPDGKVYYDVGGQTFNPFGQSYDEALWNQAAAYDPKTQSWQTLTGPTMGVPVSSELPGSPAVPTGFRGSAFSQMLPLVPDTTGNYPRASFLSAGGVLGVSPGSYVGSSSSTINTVDTTKGDSFTSEATGSLHSPRWYGNGVSLPTGQVVVTSGADRDEVINPGSGVANRTIEIFDPATKTWTVGPSQEHQRTYHNTGVLLPDGSVLIGGHAPIATGYAAPTDVAHDTLGLSSYRRDPSFQIYQPAYFAKGERPVITSAPATLQPGSSVPVATTQSDKVTKVVLVRNTAITHLVDGDQRTVQLPFTRQADGTLKVDVTGNTAVLPAGPYMLFTVTGTGADQVPSVASQLSVGPAPQGTSAAPGATKSVLKKAVAKKAARPAVKAGTTRRGARVVAQPTRTLAFTGLGGGSVLAAAVLLGAAGAVTVLRRRTGRRSEL